MFIIYKSNQINRLLLKVSEVIEKKPLSNIFKKEIFISDNKILSEYIKIFIANKKGISANLAFYSSHYFVWKLFKKFLYKKELKNIFTRSVITWKIMKIIDKKKICSYIDIKENKIKKFKFSFLMAHIFEKYLFYCPHWIYSWEQKKNTSQIDESDQWQIKLWKEIIDDYKNVNRSNDHFSNLFYNFQSIIQTNKIKKKDFPNRIFVVSSIELNSSYIEIFKKIGDFFDVYFLQITSSKEDGFQNSLMQAWKKHEYFYNFYITNSKKTKIKNYFKKNENKNLLHHIQNDLFEDRLFEKKRFLKIDDYSISIHICYNKKDEIEILHKKLLSFFDNNPFIKPSDIVVTSFKIDDYVPFIQSIFSSLDKKKQIPFFISKKFSKEKEIILSVFNNLLNLSHSRFENEEILELLYIPEIGKKFDISEEEISVLYNWIKEANIRWSINEKHKKHFLFSENKQNTWFYGIEKLLLSYSMNNTEKIWDNILSCSFINGSREELIGKLILFINTLKKWQKKLLKSKYLKSWRSLSKNLINDFFYRSDRINHIIQIIEKKWTDMIDKSLLSGYKNIVSIDILKKNFIYQNTSIHKKFSLNSVNFCHPADICFIPFKIICFIGADNKNVPQKNNLDTFNLLNKYSFLNYIDIYQKHAYLFIQIFQCTQEYFYISYVGYSVKNNNKIYPLILVDELLSYISSHFCLVKDTHLTTKEKKKKIIQHLCTLYKKEYFYKKKNVYNFFMNNSINILQNKEKKINEFQFFKKNYTNTINLIDLLNFWKNPIRYFFNCNLQIKLDFKKLEINNTEPFSVNKSDTFKIKKILLDKVVKCEDTEKIFEYYILSGKLPYHFFATVFWKEKMKEIQSISKLVTKYRVGTKTQEINISFKKYKINGLLCEIQNTGLLRWKPNIINYSDRMSLWIEHLIYSIIGGKGESKIIGYKKQMWSYVNLNPDTAYNYLLKYIEGYIQGFYSPLLLTKSGASWMDEVYDIENNCIKNDDNTKKKAYNKLLKTWHGNNYIEGEKEDVYIRYLIKILEKKEIKKICQTAEIWLLPLLKHKKIKNKKKYEYQ